MNASPGWRAALITLAGLLAIALRLWMGAGTTLTLTPNAPTACADIYAE